MDNCGRVGQSALVAQVVRQLVRTGICLMLIGCGSQRQTADNSADPGLASTPIAPSLRLDPTSTAATIETMSGSSLPTTIDDPETITGDKIGDRADPKRSPPGA